MLQRKEKALPYKKWLPKMLDEHRWSYRKLKALTGKSHSYWNQTVSGKSSIPKPEILEKLAKLFRVTPETILEYKQHLAIKKLKRNPELVDLVLKEKLIEIEKTERVINAAPLTEKEKIIYNAASLAAVKAIRRACKNNKKP